MEFGNQLRQDRRLRPPAPLPLAHQPNPVTLLRLLWRNPLEAWSREHFEQPFVTTKLPIGSVIVVNEPTAIRRVLMENASNYRKDNLQRRMLSSHMGQGLLLSENDQWRRQRRILAPLFSQRSVSQFAPSVKSSITLLLNRLRERDNTVEISTEVTRLTLEVLEQTIFSDGLGRAPDQIRSAMRIYFDNIGRIEPFDILGLPQFVPRFGRRKIRPALKLFDSAVDAMIGARREILSATPSSAPRDILTLLLQARDPENGLGLSEQEVRANVITFIAAGHETTANAITWSLFLLSQSPEWQERVAAEAAEKLNASDESADELIYARAVVEESVRLYPPLAAISRSALGPDELSGHRVKAGTLIVIAPYLLHRHKDLWKDPDIFDPTRFLGESRKNLNRFAYLPFGVGPRVCIGAAFALQEATIAVAMIARSFVIDLAPGERVWPLLRVTLRPQGGLRLHLRKRA